jgi:erythromycin esterase-like protein
MTRRLVDAVRAAAIPLAADTDLTPILNLIGDATLVLIGEATHGTHEFYRTCAALTQQFVGARGFSVVAVEADRPDAFRANRWVRGNGHDTTAEDALADFTRFPRWM